MRTRCLLLLSALVLAGSPTAAVAASPPGIGAAWVSEVTSDSVILHGEVDPEGQATTYRFEYASDEAFREKGFTGAAEAPAGGAANAGSESGFVRVSQHVSALTLDTLYHYRLVATNAAGSVVGGAQTFTTEESGTAFALPDKRGWELVSPPDKNGGAIAGPEELHGGGVIQAAAAGPGGITFSSASSFGEAPQGAPAASQYLAARSASGWSTANITAPTLSGAYGVEPDGVPYQLFSPDLARGLMLNGRRCAEPEPCPRSYSLWEGALDELAGTSGLRFEGASPDLRHLVFAGADGLDEWSAGGLTALTGTSGAKLAAQGAGAVSDDGSRVYFEAEGNLYLREGSSARQIDEAQGGGGTFQVATPDGEDAFFTKSGHLYRFREVEGLTIDLTPGGGVKGVLGIAQDGSAVYYQDGGGLEEWQDGATTTVAPGADAALGSDFPPTSGTARVSADGNRLLFLSDARLTGYDNTDAVTGQPDPEVFLWNAAEERLTCLSCNPTGERPIGPSTIPGAYANGSVAAAAQGEIVTASYKPRNLSSTSNRAFFDSADALVPFDTNLASDSYEWEAQGSGDCSKSGGCLALISSGSDPEGARFADASESGDDVFFLTSSSLVGADPGSRDLYDARVGGGFPEPAAPIPCEADACQPLPEGPEDPTVGTSIPGPPNPAVRPPRPRCAKGSRRVVRHGAVRCVRKHRRGRHRK